MQREANKSQVNYLESNSIEPQSHEKKNKKCKKSKKEKLFNPLKGFANNDLPNPFQNDETASVFYNPFQKEQEAKKSMLEKHVKLSDNPKNVFEINGKKMCINYRKGRCKFGHNCKFAHDSDLSTGSGGSTEETPAGSDSAASLYNSACNDSLAQEQPLRKRKPGLAHGLLPNKKSRNNYRIQQDKETPWVNKR